jgi:acetyltransferase-like isoleucine patch superfamily enzyme
MNGALLALGSKIVAGVTIGRNSLVYAGSVVVHDVDDNTKVSGIPPGSSHPKHQFR